MVLIRMSKSRRNRTCKWLTQVRGLRQDSDGKPIVLLFFSLSPGKREVSSLPCLRCASRPPRCFHHSLRKPGVGLLLGYLVCLSGLFLLAALPALAGWNSWAQELAKERGITAPDMEAALAWLMVSGSCGLAFALAAPRLRLRAGTAVVIFTCGLWIVSMGSGLHLRSTVPIPRDRSCNVPAVASGLARSLG